jgi:hypothetical protein
VPVGLRDKRDRDSRRFRIGRSCARRVARSTPTSSPKRRRELLARADPRSRPQRVRPHYRRTSHVARLPRRGDDARPERIDLLCERIGHYRAAFVLSAPTPKRRSPTHWRRARRGARRPHGRRARPERARVPFLPVASAALTRDALIAPLRPRHTDAAPVDARHRCSATVSTAWRTSTASRARSSAIVRTSRMPAKPVKHPLATRGAAWRSALPRAEHGTWPKLLWDGLPAYTRLATRSHSRRQR